MKFAKNGKRNLHEENYSDILDVQFENVEDE